MRKKKDEPREIPIKFVNKSEAIDSAAPESSAPEKEELDRNESEALSGGEQESAESVDAEPEVPPTGSTDLQAQLSALTQEKTALYDQLLRRQAEFENFRKRVDRERSETYQRARVEILLELLPVIDNLERAMSSFQATGADAESLRHGVELIHKQFKDALTKLGLQPVEAVGQAFDPHFHEAVTMEPTDEHKENTVIEEFERGYKLGDRLLRPAKVKVAASPER
jgi:molecular chaperone GrpE